MKSKLWIENSRLVEYLSQIWSRKRAAPRQFGANGSSDLCLCCVFVSVYERNSITYLYADKYFNGEFGSSADLALFAFTTFSCKMEEKRATRERIR